MLRTFDITVAMSFMPAFKLPVCRSVEIVSGRSAAQRRASPSQRKVRRYKPPALRVQQLSGSHRPARHPPGYCHFPKYSEEYFKQLTAEQLVTRFVRGYRK